MSFTQPQTLHAAMDALKSSPLKIIAGGTDVFPSIKQGQMPSAFLDVTRIAGLRGISHDQGVTRIGAATTWTDIVQATLPRAFDALKQAAREVGSLQIQNAGTIAGNICNASPAADGVPALLALDAQVEITGVAHDVRSVALSDFITGVRRTVLADGELVTAILIPDQADAMGSAFEKLGGRRYLVISICMTAANILVGSDGCIAQAHVAVGSCSAVAQRLLGLEADLIGQRPEDVTVNLAHLSPLSPIDDVRGSGAFRLDVVREQCRRAIVKAASK